MPDTPTPGQVCYEAYLRTWPIPGLRTWDEEPLVQQRAWEAAATAVLAQCTPQSLPWTPSREDAP